MRRVLFAGGGTAGHIEPALAVAREWRARHPQDQCIFIGSNEGLETRLVPAAGFELQTITTVAIPRTLSTRLFSLPTKLGRAVRDAQRAVAGADLIIGFGGYVSAPVYLAARTHRIPFLIHEANAKPGWANRMGSFLTKFLATAQPVDGTRFEKALITGIPLRSDVQSTLDHTTDWSIARKSAKRELGFPEDEQLVVVMGGSQGSVALNATIEKSLGAFDARSINLLHSCGSKNLLPQGGYHYRPVHYINEMAKAYLAADLIIARSGAITCSEANALARYSLFIPLPVGNGEQEWNAQKLVAAGRAEVLSQSEFTSEWLASNLDGLMAKSAASPLAGSYDDQNAAEKIVNFMEHALETK